MHEGILSDLLAPGDRRILSLRYIKQIANGLGIPASYLNEGLPPVTIEPTEEPGLKLRSAGTGIPVGSPHLPVAGRLEAARFLVAMLRESSPEHHPLEASMLEKDVRVDLSLYEVAALLSLVRDHLRMIGQQQAKESGRPRRKDHGKSGPREFVLINAIASLNAALPPPPRCDLDTAMDVLHELDETETKPERLLVRTHFAAALEKIT